MITPKRLQHYNKGCNLFLGAHFKSGTATRLAVAMPLFLRLAFAVIVFFTRLTPVIRTGNYSGFGAAAFAIPFALLLNFKNQFYGNF